AGLGESAVPDLLDALADANPAACANARAGLARLAADWGAADARCVALAHHLTRAWDSLNRPGKVDALEVAAGRFRGESAPAPRLAGAGARRLAGASRGADPEVQARALEVCAALLSRPGGAEAVSPGRAVVRACLGHAEPRTRVLAVRLALYPGMDLL